MSEANHNEIISRFNLRPYNLYIKDMEKFIDNDVAEMLVDTVNWPIRELYSYLKYSKVNLHGLKPIKKDRKKMCNRYKTRLMRNAERAYSKKISAQAG